MAGCITARKSKKINGAWGTLGGWVGGRLGARPEIGSWNREGIEAKL